MAYVFLEQATAELLLLYSRGSHTLYRRLVSVNYACFTTSLVSVGYISLAFYDYVGPTAAFYVAAIAAAMYAVVFGIFYALRIGRTSAGFTAGLSAVEKELLVSRTTRT